jgi:U4/U6 small nuclear ribonucleoprotein PRP31
MNGMSTAGHLHRGILQEVDLVREIGEPSLQLKMIKMLASKSALTARIDVCRTHADGAEGTKMREAIQVRYQKVIAPGQSKLTKILAKPDDKPRKKRGGAKKQN